MAITQFTNIPGRGQDPTTFAARADNFLGTQLPRFVTEANAFARDMDNFSADMDAEGVALRAIAASAEASADMAADTMAGVANYKGEWSALTGPLAAPAAVRHKNRLWLLAGSTPNVALSEPGVDVSRWEPVKRGMIVTGVSLNAVHGDDIVSTAAGAITITLPQGPSAGDTVSVVRLGAGLVTVLRNGSTILGAADGLVIDKANWRLTFIFAGGTWRISMEGITA